MYLFINGINRTDNITLNSIDLSDELQQRANTASFTLFGYRPSYLDDVKLYEGFPIVSATSTSITLKKDYTKALQNRIFRVGDVVWFGI